MVALAGVTARELRNLPHSWGLPIASGAGDGKHYRDAVASVHLPF